MSSIRIASPPDCLVSYPGHSLGESYLSAEMQSVNFTTPADWTTGHYLGDSYPSVEMQSVYSAAPHLDYSAKLVLAFALLVVQFLSRGSRRKMNKGHHVVSFFVILGRGCCIAIIIMISITTAHIQVQIQGNTKHNWRTQIHRRLRC